MHTYLTAAGLRAVIRDFGLEAALECRCEALEALMLFPSPHDLDQSLLNTRAALAIVRLRAPMLG